jgi:hypothetical protein
MQTVRHPSPLPPDPVGTRRGSPLPSDPPIAVLGESPLPPDNRQVPGARSQAHSVGGESAPTG